MITEEMVLAAAKAIFNHTNTAKAIQWDLLPSHVQQHLCDYARVGLEAAEAFRPKPIIPCNHEDMSCPPGECDDLYPYSRPDMGR